MTIFYFTATGNSLYVAKRLGGKLISIPQFLKSGDSAYNDDIIGVVYPCYSGGIPRIVKRFLAKIKLKATYTIAIMTYGNEHTSALDQMDKYIQKQGIRFDYMNYILMVNNYLPMYKIEEEFAKVPQKGIENAIATVIKDIQDRKQYIPSTGFADKFWGMIFRSGAMKITGETSDQRFTVDNMCALCGTCTKVCPVNNININNNLIFNHQCEGCLACIHHCPTGALHIAGERSAERFRNENIQLDEITAANNIR